MASSGTGIASWASATFLRFGLGLADADALVVIPEEANGVPADAEVDALLVSDLAG